MNFKRPLLTAILAAGLAAPAYAQLTMPGGAPPPPAPAPASGPGPGPAAAPGQQAAGPPQADPLTRDFRGCVDKAQASMQAKKENDPEAIHACLAAEVKRQEVRFARHSATLVNSMQEVDKKRLEAANAAWRRFRDANCAFYADPKGIAPLRVTNADCTLNLTVNRVLELERLTMMVAQQDQAKAAAEAKK